MKNILKFTIPFGFISAMAMAIPPAEQPFISPSDLPANVLAVPDSGGPYFVGFGSTIQLDASGSIPAYYLLQFDMGPPFGSDPSSDTFVYSYIPFEIISYKWDIGVDGTIDFASSSPFTLVDYDYLLSNGFNVGTGAVIPVGLNVSSMIDSQNTLISLTTITVIPEPSSTLTAVVLVFGTLVIKKLRSRN